MQLKVGEIVEGTVKSLTKFGAFVALDANTTGLVHISEVAHTYVSDLHEYLTEGQTVKVMVIGLDNGKINLSIKRTLPAPTRQQSQRPRGGAQQRPDGMGQEAAQPCTQRPYTAGNQPHQRQTRQHAPAGALAPYLFRAGDSQKHAPRHEKAIDPIRHGAALPSTGGAAPLSFRTPRRTPTPARGISPPAPGRRPPSSPDSPRRRATDRRTRR